MTASEAQYILAINDTLNETDILALQQIQNISYVNNSDCEQTGVSALISCNVL